MKKRLRDFALYRQAAKVNWFIRDEIFRWKYWFISNFPGEIGAYIRSRLMSKLFARCGKNPYFSKGINLENPGKVEIGDFVKIAIDVYISGGGGVKILNNVMIGPRVMIWSIDHRYDEPLKNIMDQGYTTKGEIIIGEDCWIGAGSQILSGVKVGRGSVIAAGTVLRRSVKAFSIVAGNPGRVVNCRIPIEEYRDLPSPHKEGS